MTTLGDVIGCYPGYNNAANLTAFEAAIGQKVKTVVQFGDVNANNSPGAVWGILKGDTKTPATLLTRPELRMVLSVPLAFSDSSKANWLAGNQYTLDQVAAGKADSIYSQIAGYLAGSPFARKVVRLGWELNAPWYPHSAAGHSAASFVAAWKHVHDYFTARVPGVQFDWCLAGASGALPIDPAAYPGDAYVDVIGMDVYNRAGSAAQQAADLAGLAAFAAQHGKPMGFAEWGLSSDGGDDPSFVDRMGDFVAGHDVVYVVEYNGLSPERNNPTSTTDLSTSGGLTPYPKAKAELIKRLTTTTTTTPPPVDPPPVDPRDQQIADLQALLVTVQAQYGVEHAARVAAEAIVAKVRADVAT